MEQTTVHSAVRRTTRNPGVSVGHWFAERAARDGRRPALTFEGQTWTYAQIQDQVDRLAAGLASGGLERGDRVGFLGVNQPAALLTMIAASRLGAIYVPLNFRLAGPELEFIINDADLHTLVVGADNTGVIDAVRDRLRVQRYLATEHESATWPAFEALLSGPSPAEQPTPPDPDDLAIIMYTSGTTGVPKGVMLTHANLWWNNISLLHTFDVLSDDVTLTSSPLFHIAGLNVTIFTTWMRGGRLVLHRNFEAQATLDDIEKLGVTSMFGVPAMYNAIAQLPAFSTADLSSVRVAICGGAPVPEALLKVYADRGVGMLQGYGLTETCPAAIFLVAEHSLAKLGSCGKPPLYIEAKLVGEDGDIEGPDVRGEICIRGANVSVGYWNRPDATADSFDDDGWFFTGDVGVRDADGFYYVVDRVKDMVITGGENVYPTEVENVLYSHPKVLEVAVIGLPDEKWGEAVTAVVVTKPDKSLSLEEMRAFTSERLARYKVPQRLHVLDELPRNPTGKVLKTQLREELAQA
jgi:fatty-acyl-CoA synthase